MGPRPDGRGRGLHDLPRFTNIGRQWGRDRMAAEGTDSDRYALASLRRQWGRDRMAAEGSRLSAALSIFSNVNGAATGWPRKACRDQPYAHHGRRLLTIVRLVRSFANIRVLYARRFFPPYYCTASAPRAEPPAAAARIRPATRLISRSTASSRRAAAHLRSSRSVPAQYRTTGRYR